MEKKNYILLTIIAIAVLLVSVIGATFAYFATTTQTTAKSSLQATTSGSAAVFSTSSTDNLELTITTADMQQGAVGGGSQAAETDTGDLVVSLTGGAGTTCTYNITYTKDERGVEAGGGDVYTPTQGYETSEFVISGTSDKNGQPTLAATGYGSLSATVITGASIGAGETVTWTFTATIYNLNVNQWTALGNKTFKGSFQVASVVC